MVLDQQELDLTPPPQNTRLDKAFQDRSLCVTGLPVRQVPTNPAIGTVFARFTPNYHFKVLTPAIYDPSEEEPVPMPIPSGPKARLLMLHFGRLARRAPAHRPWLELGSLKQTMQDIGVPLGGRNLEDVKDQFVRLTHSLFDASIRRRGETLTAFRHDALTRTSNLSVIDIQNFKSGRLDRMAWPEGIMLTSWAHHRLRNDIFDGSAERLRELASAPTSIDMFLHLAHRLPRVKRRGFEVWTWREMMEEFGTPGKIAVQWHMQERLKLALSVYPEAEIADHADGIVLFRSPAPLGGLPRTMITGHSLPQEVAMHPS